MTVNAQLPVITGVTVAVVWAVKLTALGAFLTPDEHRQSMLIGETLARFAATGRPVASQVLHAAEGP